MINYHRWGSLEVEKSDICLLHLSNCDQLELFWENSRIDCIIIMWVWIRCICNQVLSVTIETCLRMSCWLRQMLPAVDYPRALTKSVEGWMSMLPLPMMGHQLLDRVGWPSTCRTGPPAQRTASSYIFTKWVLLLLLQTSLHCYAQLCVCTYVHTYVCMYAPVCHSLSCRFTSKTCSALCPHPMH